MNILLSGATGFIGKYTLSHFLDLGINVRVISRSNKPSIFHKNNNLEWIKSEFSLIEERYFKNIDLVLNLAAAGVSPKIASYQEMIDINIYFPLKLIMMAAKSNIKRFISVGTCYEYGYKKKGILCKPYDNLDPLGIYAATKVSSFYSLKQLAHEYDIHFCYGRIFNAYGIFDQSQTFWQLLYKSANNGSDFSMTFGEQIRDFIPVETVAKRIANVCLINHNEIKSPYLFNIGSGVGLKVKDFARNEWIRLKAEGKLIIGGVKSRKNEPQYLVADISNLIN